MGEKKKWKENPSEKTNEKTKKSYSSEQDPRVQHFSRPMAGETQPWVSVAGRGSADDFNLLLDFLRFQQTISTCCRRFPSISIGFRRFSAMGLKPAARFPTIFQMISGCESKRLKPAARFLFFFYK
jgi:hypothetical protein